jgi:transposase
MAPKLMTKKPAGRVVRKAMKKAMKKFQHYTDAELDVVKKMKRKGKQPQEVASAMDRDISSVARHFKRIDAPDDSVNPVGRPPALTQAEVDLVAERADQMIEAAGCEYQVTMSMVKKACKISDRKCSDAVALSYLHERGIYFRPFRQKPVRTAEDEKDRIKFAKSHKDKPEEFWGANVHAFQDIKFFKPYLTADARSFARKQTARGALRGRGKGLAKGYVKPKKTLKQNFGKTVQMAVALSSKKVLMCHQVQGSWNKEAACEMYEDHLAPALRKAYPTKRRFTVLEDNDPVGYKPCCDRGQAQNGDRCVRDP